MDPKDKPVTIYWPSSALELPPQDAYLIGWSSGDATSTVVCCVLAAEELLNPDKRAKVVQGLRAFAAGPGYLSLRSYCAGSPCIVGSITACKTDEQLEHPSSGLPVVLDILPESDCSHGWLDIRCRLPSAAASSAGGQRGTGGSSSGSSTAGKAGSLPFGPSASRSDYCIFVRHTMLCKLQQQQQQQQSEGNTHHGHQPQQRPANIVCYRAAASASSSPSSPLSFPAGAGYYAAGPPRAPPLRALGSTAMVRNLPEVRFTTALDAALARVNAAGFVTQFLHSAPELAKEKERAALETASSALAEQQLLQGQPGSAVSFSAFAKAALPHTSPQPQQQQQQQEHRQQAGILARLARAAALPFLFLLLCIRSIAVLLLQLLEMRLPPSLPLVGGLMLYERSTLARQLHLKLRDYCKWPSSFLALQRLRGEVESGRSFLPPEALFHYTALWHDSLWRSLMDLGLGIAACLLLYSSSWALQLVLSSIHSVGQVLHLDVLRAWMTWLMDLPAGLKLNHSAGRKIGGAVLSCIGFWEYITAFLTPYEPIIVLLVGFVGCGGASMLLAMASDVLEMATFHIYLLHAQFAWLHNQQMGLLGSLWQLFRGKKKNVLRSRVDSNDYDIAQLLLGTLFFTVVFFLFPTSLVYYLFFLTVWSGIQLTRALLWMLITLLNNLPAYTLAVLAASSRPPAAGVSLQLLAFAGQQQHKQQEAEASKQGGQQEGKVTARQPRQKAVLASALLSASVPGEWYYETESEDEGEGQLEGQGQGVGAAAAGIGTVLTLTDVSWYQLSSQPASLSLALVPFSKALTLLSKRYSFGSVLKTLLLGERAAALFKAAPVPAPTPAPAPAPAPVPAASATPPAAAGAPVLAAGAAGSSATAATTPSTAVSTPSSSASSTGSRTMRSIGSWRQYWQDVNMATDMLLLSHRQ